MTTKIRPVYPVGNCEVSDVTHEAYNVANYQGFRSSILRGGW